MSYTIVELDAATAARLRVPIRRLPVPEAVAERLLRPRFDLCGLVDELDREFATADDDTARLFATTIGRLALAASRRSGRDGFVDAAHHYADIAVRWSPDDPEIRAAAALTAHEAGDLETAVRRYADLLGSSPSAAAIALRLMAVRAAMAAGDLTTAQRWLGQLPAIADTWDEVWELRSAVDDDLALTDADVATADLPMRAAPSADRLPFDVLCRGRRAVIDERRDGFARIRRSDGLAGWVDADGLRSP